MRKPNYFTEDEVQAMLKVVAGTGSERLLRITLETAAKTSGIRSLRLSSLRFDSERTVVYVQDDGIAGRPICMSKETSGLLWHKWQMDRFDMQMQKEHPHRRSSRRRVGDYRLFPHSKKTLNRYLQKWAAKAGITRHVNWGMLKHTSVIHLVKKGMSFEEIALRLRLNKRTLYLMYHREVPTPQQLEEQIEYRL